MTKLPHARVIFEHFDEDGKLDRTTEHAATVYTNSKRSWISYLGGTRTVVPVPETPGAFRCFGSKRIRSTSFASFRDRVQATLAGLEAGRAIVERYQ